MKKIFLFLISAISFAETAQGQIKYKLTAMPDNLTYVVSLIPDATWVFPQNVTTTAQVTLRLPSTTGFKAGRIKSLVAETAWTDNAYLQTPKGDPQSNYISFSLQTVGTRAFRFERGTELPLFTFENIGKDCIGFIELIDNNNISTKAVIANGYNIGQHISTLGAGGEAFSGNVEGKVVCQGATTAVKDLVESPLSISKVFPIPAADEFSVVWQINDASATDLQMVVTNGIGETIFTQKLTNNQAFQTTKINVRQWAEGIYFLRLLSDNGVSKAKKILVIR